MVSEVLSIAFALLIVFEVLLMALGFRVWCRLSRICRSSLGFLNYARGSIMVLEVL